MVTGDYKNKIDAIWDAFAAGGLTNPLDVIEQLTYLMFMHDLDENDNIKAKDASMLGTTHDSIFKGTLTINGRRIKGEELKWSVFRDFPAEKMYRTVLEFVFPFIKDLQPNKNSSYSKYMNNAIFKIPTPLLLDKVVSMMDDLYEQMAKEKTVDVRGDVYEYMLSKLLTAGINGQFRTPRHIIDMMVQLIQPGPEDVICDPACGTSGFLVGACEYLKENYKKEIFFNDQNKKHFMNTMFTGFDTDSTMLRIGAMNMMLHGVNNAFIEYRDSLSEQNTDNEKYSVVLANPPFKGSLDYDIVSPDLLKSCKTKKTELLFLNLFMRVLKVGGKCACIVPDGVLFGSSKAHKDIRKKLIEENLLQAVISMPSGVFEPYAGVSTAVLVFTKTGHGGTDKVWFYDMKADGKSLDKKRDDVEENDLPDIIKRFHNLNKESNRKRTEQSFFIAKQEIVDNDYDLSINKYKEVEYVPVKYPSTRELLKEITSINNKIEELTNALEDDLDVKG